MLFWRLTVWLLIFTSFVHRLPAQTPAIDSLKQAAMHEHDPSKKIGLVLQLASDYERLQPDTLDKYLASVEDLLLYAVNRDSTRYAILYYKTIALVNRGKLVQGLENANRYLGEITDKKYSNKLYLNFLYLKTNTLIRTNRYNDAIDQYNKILFLAESNRDTFAMAKLMNGIGWAYMELNLYRDALNWFNKAIDITSNPVYTKQFGRIYNNIASVYSSLQKYDSAERVIDKALLLTRAQDDFTSTANGLNIKADIYMHTGRAADAEPVLLEALELRKKTADPYYIISDMYELARLYGRNNKPREGIRFSLEGIALAEKHGLIGRLPELYTVLGENYNLAGLPEEYGKAMEKVIFYKDSIYKINSAEALADLQARYELQKKENIIIQQKLNLARKNYLLIGSGVFAILLLAMAASIFAGYRKRQKIKMEIALEEEKRMAAKAVMDAGEQERKRIAADLHDNLGVYAASLASNLSYVQVNPADERAVYSFRELESNSNAIISQLNDTIWVLKKDVLSLTAISDRIKIFINRIHRSYPGMQVTVEEQIETDHSISSSQGFHLYRILQEAISNALKHSGGRNILVKITGNVIWTASVTDDGKGIDASQAIEGEGNGMFNMKHRSREAGWNIYWHNLETGGTEVVIVSTTN